MIGSLSRRKLIETFDYLDGKIALIVFNRQGEKVVAITGLNFVSCFMRMTRYTNYGQAVRTFLEPSKEILTERSLARMDELYRDQYFDYANIPYLWNVTHA